MIVPGYRALSSDATVITLFVGDHLESQLVVITQKKCPLASLGDLRRWSMMSVMGMRSSNVRP